MGVYVFEPEAVDLIEPGLRLDLPELVLRLLERGDKVAGYPFDGYWLDIGRHSDYQKALDDYEQMKDALLAPVGGDRVEPHAPPGRPHLRRGRGRGRRRGRPLGLAHHGPAHRGLRGGLRRAHAAPVTP